jgi:hypothetical protein
VLSLLQQLLQGGLLLLQLLQLPVVPHLHNAQQRYSTNQGEHMMLTNAADVADSAAQGMWAEQLKFVNSQCQLLPNMLDANSGSQLGLKPCTYSSSSPKEPLVYSSDKHYSSNKYFKS